MKPAYQIRANDKDITAAIGGALKEIRLKDGRGLTADLLTVVLDDTARLFSWPDYGAALDVWLGFSGESLHYKGRFVVDELAHSGPPDQLTITAKPADFIGSLKVPVNNSWHDVTLGAVVSEIAARNGLTPAISAELRAIRIPHLDQTNESDLNLITRLGVLYDAIGKPAAGRLVFTGKGAGKTAGGQLMPVVDLLRSDISKHRYIEKGRTGKHGGIKAYWLDDAGAETRAVVVGGGENIKALKPAFKDKEAAAAAAGAAFRKLSRAEKELMLTFNHGLPELVAECVANVQGIRAEIDGRFIVSEVSHKITGGGGGLSSTAKLERMG